MFEEDTPRCFICQAPCKQSKLFCSDECQNKDTKGSHSPARKFAPIHLTSQLPPSLSPMIRPAHFAPSPRLHAQNDYSSNSSITSSPLQSPETIPQGADSPHKDPLDLPPPAFPKDPRDRDRDHFAAYGSVPVKIPALVPRPSAHHVHAPVHAPVGSQGTPLHGTSIDTLRFGRRPGVINSVISPNALLPRCACGKPANHRSRASSKERLPEADFTRLTLGPSVLHQSPRMVPVNLGDKPRVASDSSLGGRPAGHRISASGYTTPHDTLALGSSLLSRSRSDPIPPNLQTRRDQAKLPEFHHHHHHHHAHAQFISPSPSRRASAAAADMPTRPQPSGRARAMTRTTSGDRPRARHAQPAPADAGAPRAPEADSRGRSRSRARLTDRERERDCDIEPAHLLQHEPERESAPSRSRHRRDEREREQRYAARGLDRVASAREEPAIAAAAAAAAAGGVTLDSPTVSPITPSWSRLADVGTGEGEVVPRRVNRGVEQGRMERGRAY